MNQIIFSKFNNEIQAETNKKRKKLLIVFKYQFGISILVTIFCFSYYAHNLYLTKEKENLSKHLLTTYSVNQIYADTTGYNTTINTNDKTNEPFVIGLIEIKKLNITYPILSEVSDELLKIAPCRFFRTYAK